MVERPPFEHVHGMYKRSGTSGGIRFEYSQVHRLADQLWGRGGLSNNQLWEAAVLTGAASFMMGDTETAKRFFLIAKRVAPHKTPSRSFYPESIRKQYALCKP